MKRRVGSWLLGSVPLLLSSALAGCYSHHTADEALLDIEFPEDAYPEDARVDDDDDPEDAGPTQRCTQTDPIQLLICQFTQGAGQLGNGSNGAQTPNLGGITDLVNQFLGGADGSGGLDLQDLAGLLGGAGRDGQPSLEDLLGGFFPQTARDAGAAPSQPSLQDILGGLFPQTPQAPTARDAGAAPSQPSLQDILGGLFPQRDGGTAQPSLADLLGGLVPRPDAGVTTPRPTLPGINAETCAQATTNPGTRLFCTLGGFTIPARGATNAPADAGTPFPNAI